jgi:hypothetical protein
MQGGSNQYKRLQRCTIIGVRGVKVNTCIKRELVKADEVQLYMHNIRCTLAAAVVA